jgi:general secretion pathway protein F
MPNFRYRALTPTGDMVVGFISASTAAEVGYRVEYLGMFLIETALDKGASSVSGSALAFFNRARSTEVTLFTRDIALILKAGARLEDGLELLASDMDVGRMRPIVNKLRASILAGESFSEAIGRHPNVFPAMYIALVRVGEASGTLDQILEMLGRERMRSEALRRKITDAIQYPAFILLAACCVLVFFFMFVLPQFSAVLRDFGARTDTALSMFLSFSDFLRGNGFEVIAALAILLAGGLWILRQPNLRSKLIAEISRLPGVSSVFQYYRTALFCRSLGILLTSGVALTATLRIVIEIMAVTGSGSIWAATADKVRHGGKLSDALMGSNLLPAMAVRMLRLGEETGQLPTLAGNVAEFYESKLQRSLDRIVGIVGPLAIITISLVVGGLIVSVMTALLSISEIAI